MINKFIIIFIEFKCMRWGFIKILYSFKMSKKRLFLRKSKNADKKVFDFFASRARPLTILEVLSNFFLGALFHRNFAYF